MLVSNLWPGKG